MNGVNEAVSKLKVVDRKTIKNIDVMPILFKYVMPLQSRLLKANKVLESNKRNILKSILMVNVLPLLVTLYSGPKIQLSLPIESNSVLSINYPNTDSSKVFDFKTLVKSKISSKNIKPKTSKTVSRPIRPVVVNNQYRVNGLLPSDLQPFEDVSRVIPSKLLNLAKNDYNKMVSKYFKILNKYPNINDRNINTIKEDLKKNILNDLVALYYPVQKYPIELLQKVFSKLVKYFVLDVSDKNDFAKNVLPLLNNFYKGQINIKEFNLI
jgi:hypothetical protein